MVYLKFNKDSLHNEGNIASTKMSLVKFQLKPVELVIMLAPFWWVLGLDLFVYLAFSLFIIKKQYNQVSNRSGLLAALFIVLGLYLVFRTSVYMASTSELSRSLSSFYNSALIFSGCAYYIRSVNSYTGGNHESNPFLKGYSFIFFVSVPTACVLYIIALSDVVNDLHMQTFVGLIYPGQLPGVWDSAKEAIFYRPEWGTGESTPRLTLFSQFPTSASLVFAISGYMFMLQKYRPLKATIFIYLAILFLVAFTQTRTVLGGVLLSIPLSILLFYFDKKIIISVVVFSFVSIILLVFLFVVFGELNINSGYRINSVISRFSNYFFAANLVANENFIFGLGIKPFNADLFKFPIGSHSTVISQFTKGGAVALVLAFTIFYIIPGMVWLKVISICQLNRKKLKKDRIRNASILFQAQVVLWIWLLFEDFDAIPLSSVTVFVFMGLVMGFKSELNKES